MPGDNERLASLEAKIGFLKDLLQEIKTNIKDQPSRSEFNDVKRTVRSNEAKITSVYIKVGAILIAFSMVIGGIIKYFIR